MIHRILKYTEKCKKYMPANWKLRNAINKAQMEKNEVIKSKLPESINNRNGSANKIKSITEIIFSGRIDLQQKKWNFAWYLQPNRDNVAPPSPPLHSPAHV